MFTYVWGGGGGGAVFIVVVCGAIARKFCTMIDNQGVSSNVERNFHKINDVIDSDVVILRNLAKKTFY